ncbi:MAG TPA: hypothetical protein VJ575_04885 [Pseudogulbenkiania sp.]|nr:hypothetical protein [Pseudogulbenkiania sp.]
MNEKSRRGHRQHLAIAHADVFLHVHRRSGDIGLDPPHAVVVELETVLAAEIIALDVALVLGLGGIGLLAQFWRVPGTSTPFGSTSVCISA